MDVTGTIRTVLKEQTVGAKGFRKQDFVLDVEGGRFPQIVCFTLTQERLGLLENYREGDQIRVHFDLKGREWTSPQGEVKYFNTLEAWKIEDPGSSNSGRSSGGSSSGSATNRNRSDEAESKPIGGSMDDDLPF